MKQQKQGMIGRYGKSDDSQGFFQVLMTLVPLAFLWWIAVTFGRANLWVVAAALPLLILFTLRVFALMHECGHRSLFRSVALNRWIGFALGVLSGMPQYVWAQHHNYHHANNGNWDRYRGPYATLSVDEYAALSTGQQRFYRHKCSIAAAPLAGFIYLILNPRLTWISGTVGMCVYILRGKFAGAGLSVRELSASYRTRYWKSPREYHHMLWNNVVLLSAWGVMCWHFGAALFFTIYLLTVSIAGGLGIVLFTVQHNFEHSYATGCASWDYDTGAIEGTSFLVLPAWLNFFTANIGYHHIHHLSSSIPSYRLVQCHNEYEHLFPSVVRVKLSEVCGAMKCILWDIRAHRIITLAEYLRRA
ncbi:MAG TPA: fatty acid desaturase [Steroidobacteraceae bacterium]|nr:fatty acid desaturase [Steroidobacteraceae bacterium]